jgi:outer membrane protein assembly factor BamA
VEPGRYGVEALAFEGLDALDEEALEACLITRERDHFGVRLGLSGPACGRPPFDHSAPTLRLWRWPWTEWPTFNHAVFEQDLERVVRWYRARGYYDARVVNVRYDPPAAEHPALQGPCARDGGDCTVGLVVTVEEGLPTLVGSIRLEGLPTAAPNLAAELWESLEVRRGDPIDEAHYDQDRERIREFLRARGYAAATVDGQVEVDTAQRTAQVVYRADSGPAYRFGSVTVSGHGELPAEVIRAAAALPTGAPYDPEVVDDVQSAVFALGAFSAVEVRENLDPEAARVDLDVIVTPLPRDALRVGVGVTNGALRRTETADLVSIPQWDIHLFANYERRHLFGTLGRFSIEERPRLIFNREFPRFAEPEPGNFVTLALIQPGSLEPRTETFQRFGWDYGPEPFLGFRRSDLFLRAGARRGFWGRRLLVTLAAQQDRFIVLGRPAVEVDSDTTVLPTSYDYFFVEQDVRLDLRDDRARTTRGWFAALNTTQSPRFGLSDWTAFRVAPEARSFVRLPLDVVWASRVAAAAFFLSNASSALDVLSQELGPNTYRLRGGGAYSNRGFLAGRLGAGLQGGVRRWEASSELRVPLGESLVLAGFVDFGDVNNAPSFRLAHLNTSVGYGVRYYTVLGALRLDVGYRIPRWQRLDGTGAIPAADPTLPLSSVPGALHFTIGDAF